MSCDTSDTAHRENLTHVYLQILETITVHCHEKLLLLTPSYIRTAMGKEMALPRHELIEAFVRAELSIKELCVKHGVDYV